jgi:hypothetical protein
MYINIQNVSKKVVQKSTERSKKVLDFLMVIQPTVQQHPGDFTTPLPIRKSNAAFFEKTATAKYVTSHYLYQIQSCVVHKNQSPTCHVQRPTQT